MTQLAGSVPDPTGHIERLLDLIAGTVGIPKRLLIGSERGELASSQDENNWAMTIAARHTHHAEPIILRPFIDKLISIQALPMPRFGYVVEWPNLLAQTEEEEAKTALLWTQALAAYAGTLSAPEEIMPLPIYLEDIFGFDKAQVQRILEHIDERMHDDEP